MTSHRLVTVSSQHEFTIVGKHIGHAGLFNSGRSHHFPKYNFALMNVTLTDYFLPHFGCQCDVESKFCSEFAPDLRPVSIGSTCLPIVGDESTAIQ